MHAASYIPHVLAEVWSTTFYMGKFNGPTAKPHRLWSNDEGLLELIHQQAGTLTSEERKALSGAPLARTYTDRQGKKRFAGIPEKLKLSQRLGFCVYYRGSCVRAYTPEFGAALAKLASDRRQVGPLHKTYKVFRV